MTVFNEDKDNINQEGEKALKSVTGFARNVLVTGLGIGVLVGRKAKEAGSAVMYDVLSSAGDALKNASESFNSKDEVPHSYFASAWNRGEEDAPFDEEEDEDEFWNAEEDLFNEEGDDHEDFDGEDSLDEEDWDNIEDFDGEDSLDDEN